MTGKIYLDYCATTPVHPSVKNAMMAALDTGYGNPSSMHWIGMEAANLINDTRREIAANLGCLPEEIYFTGGATEADNLALFGVLRKFPSEKAHLITSGIEHHAILHSARQLEHEGYSVTYLPVDSHGLVNPDDVQKAIQPQTKLISIMLVNNEVGSIQPIAKIGRIAREHNIPLHTDAVQSIGIMDVRVDELNLDMLSLSAHKIYGPKGIGALYVRKGIELTPLTFGGSQERSLRPGTENVPGILGLGAALNLVSEHRTQERTRLSRLRKRLVIGIKAAGLNVDINGPSEDVAPHIVSISFTGADAEMLLIRLNKEGVAVSMGSACTSHEIEPSHVLTAMGLPRKQIESTLRISLGLPTTDEEIDVLIESLDTVIKRVLI
jgi:cysteine desulfurase